MSTELKDILEMSVAERIRIVEDIWNSIAAESESLPLTEDQRKELDRRLAVYDQNPDEGVSWDELKSRMRKTS